MEILLMETKQTLEHTTQQLHEKQAQLDGINNTRSGFDEQISSLKEMLAAKVWMPIGYCMFLC